MALLLEQPQTQHKHHRSFQEEEAKTEQQVLEDFDTGRSAQRYDKACERNCCVSAAKCGELSVTAATEHGQDALLL